MNEVQTVLARLANDFSRRADCYKISYDITLAALQEHLEEADAA